MLQIKQKLQYYCLNFKDIPIKCGNTSVINLTKSPVQHSRSKYIEIRYHFTRNHVSDGNICGEFVPIENQYANIFIKPFKKIRFE